MKLNLKLDTEEIKNIKSLKEREEEYSDYLGPVEFTIAQEYHSNKKLKDKEVIISIKNMRNNYEKGIEFFKNELERNIYEALCEATEDEPITHHELRLVLNYILWSIDNRDWIGDNRGYVKWITYFFDLMEEDEEEDYKEKFRNIARGKGFDSKAIDAMLMDELDYAPSKEDEAFSKIDSEFFAMSNDEKEKFIIQNGPIYSTFIDSYLYDLAKENNFEKIDSFFNKFIIKYFDYIPVYLFMFGVYEAKDIAKAKSFLDIALVELNKIQDIPKELKNAMENDINNLLKVLNKK